MERTSNVTSTEFSKENGSTEYSEMTSQFQDIQDNTATSVDVDDSSFVGTTDSTFEIDELIPVNSLTTRKYRIHPNTTPGPMEVTTEEGSGEVGSGPDNIGELFGFGTESLASGDDDMEATTDGFPDTSVHPTSISTEEGSGDIGSLFLTKEELFSTESPDELTSVVDDTSTMTSDQSPDTSALPPDDGSGDTDGAFSTDRFFDKSTESPEMKTFADVSSIATTDWEDEEQTTSAIITSEETLRTIDFRQSSIPEDETTVFSVDVSTQSTPQTSDISDDGSGDSSGDMSMDILTTQEYEIFDLSTGGVTTEDVGTSETTVDEMTTDSFTSEIKTTSDSVESTLSQDIEEITTESYEDTTLEQIQNMSTQFSVPDQGTELTSTGIETTSQSAESDATSVELEITTQNPDLKEITTSANVSADIPEINMTTTKPEIDHVTSSIPDYATSVTPKPVEETTNATETSAGVETKSSTTKYLDSTVVEEVIGVVTVESGGRW